MEVLQYYFWARLLESRAGRVLTLPLGCESVAALSS